MTKHTTEETTKPMTCPHCGSTNVGKYLYGFPGMNQKMMQDELDGKIIIAGCIITDDDPGYHCHNCKRDFGKREY